MPNSPTISPAPTALIDVLNALLEAELNSVFRFMDEGSPYLGRATVDVRKPLAEMVETNNRHAEELSNLIESLGGYPVLRSLRAEEQYLAFLSLKFLLPKLADEKRLTIQRYVNAMKAIGLDIEENVEDVLQSHITAHRAHLETLDRAAADAVRAK